MGEPVVVTVSGSAVVDELEKLTRSGHRVVSVTRDGNAVTIRAVPGALESR